MSGLCIFLGQNLNACVSFKKRVVARSSTKSKYHALSLVASELLWIQFLLSEIGIKI